VKVTHNCIPPCQELASKHHPQASVAVTETGAAES